VILGMALGVFCGLLLGERCDKLSFIGDIYVTLLLMCVLPYVVITLIYSIGKLEMKEAKVITLKGGFITLTFWAIAIFFVLLMPTTFPEWKASKFFSKSLIETPQQVSFIKLYLTDNPFNAMAEGLVPAVVLFCICIGVALLTLPDKQVIIRDMEIFGRTMEKVTSAMVKLAPIGTFAMTAVAAGTMSLDEIGRIQVYFIAFIVSALLMTFCIFPLIISTFTPYTYKDIFRVSKETLIIAFTTSNLFILLPLIAKDIKVLMKQYKVYTEERNTLNDIIIPICYIFPCTGKLLTILFITFAAWYDGVTIAVSQYPEFILTSLLSFIGSANYAIPFLLNHYHISADLFDVYLMAGVINGKFATLLASIYLFGFTLMATAWITGFIVVDKKKIIKNMAIIIVVTIISLVATKYVLALTPNDNNTVKEMLLSMRINNQVETKVDKKYPEPGLFGTLFTPPPGENRINIIKKRGILRVGYNPNARPFTYFNQNDELVGFDIAMANILARDLKCKLEFIPIRYDNIGKGLDAGIIDIAMAGISKTVDRITDLDFTDSYMTVTLAFVTKDYNLDKYRNTEDIKKIKDFKIAVLDGSAYQDEMIKLSKNLHFVKLEKVDDFYTDKVHADVMLTSAEQGAAYCMLYPKFDVIVPKPDIHKNTFAYVIAKHDLAFSKYLNEWLAIKRDQGIIDQLKAYWIYGRNIEYHKPRWNIWDNLLNPTDN
jgi:Na+/H+-dicarboxylate symporter/ABC-type amino acid transport substrate-binding protein